MKAVLGRVANIKSFPSMGIARLEVEVPIESYVDAVGLLFGQDALITVASPELKDQLGRYGVHDAESGVDTPVAGDSEAAQQEAVVPSGQTETHAGKENAHDGIQGSLTKLAGILCKNPDFWTFLNNYDANHWLGGKCASEDEAAGYVRKYCRIDSRRDIDASEDAATAFHELRRAWIKWNEWQ